MALGVGRPDGLSNSFTVLQFRCGSQETLAVKDVVDHVKAFYDRFYTKSKTVIMTRGSSKNLDITAISSLISKFDADNSPGSMSVSPATPSTAYQPQPVPQLKHSTFVFVSTNLSPRIIIRCFIPGFDAGYTHYVIKSIESRLQALLVQKLGFCSQVEVDYTNHRTFYEVEYDARLTETGASSPAKVVAAIRHFLFKAAQLLVLNQDRFLQYRLKQQQSIFLQKRKLPQQNTFQTFIDNYMRFGSRNIFAEDKIPQDYAEAPILAALEKLKKADWIVIYNDKFTIAKNDEHPSTEINLEKLIQATNTGTRLSLSALQKDETAESKLQLISQQLEGTSYTGFNTTLSGLDSLVALSPLRDSELLPAGQESDPQQNSNISEQAVAAIVKSFTPRLRTPLDLEWKPTKPDATVFESTYPPSMSLPLVQVLLELNFNKTSLNVVEYFNLIFAKGVLAARFAGLNYKLKQQAGELTLKASPTGLQLALTVLPSQELDAIQYIKKALAETKVKEEEWRNSLQSLKSESEQFDKPYLEALQAFDNWACPYMPNKFMIEKHFEKLLQKPPIKELPKIFVTKVVIMKQSAQSGHSELSPDVDASNIGQYLPLLPGAGFSNGPDSLKDLNFFTNHNHTIFPISLKSASSGPSAPGVYVMVVPLGKRTAKMSQIMATLRPLFHTAVYRHMRRELNIGYVTAVQSKVYLGQLYLQAIVQSDRKAQEVDEAMVEVIRRLRAQVDSLTQETLEQLKSLTAGIIVTPFESLASEAEFWKTIFKEGLGPKYFQDSIAAAKSLTLKDVKDVFNEHFSPEKFLNIVLDLQPTGQISSEDLLAAQLGM